MSTTLENKVNHHIERSYGSETKTILLVDDDVAFTNLVKLDLEGKENYVVCVENDSRMAIATARKVLPDIIFLAVVMPELDGIEVHRQLMEDPILKLVPVIFLTGIVEQEEVDAKKGWIGGQYFIAKPVDAYRLVTAIEEHALGSRTSPNHVSTPHSGSTGTVSTGNTKPSFEASSDGANGGCLPLSTGSNPVQRIVVADKATETDTHPADSEGVEKAARGEPVVQKTAHLILHSTEEYRKAMKDAADIYLYDLREELWYCKGHQFLSQIPEHLHQKIDELIKAIDDHRKSST